MLEIGQSRISNATGAVFTIIGKLNHKRWEWLTESGSYGASFEWTILEGSKEYSVIH